MLYLAWFQLACTLLAVSRTIVGSHLITKLAKIPLDRSRADSSWPKVSIVVAARNEEREVEAATDAAELGVWTPSNDPVQAIDEALAAYPAR